MKLMLLAAKNWWQMSYLPQFILLIAKIGKIEEFVATLLSNAEQEWRIQDWIIFLKMRTFVAQLSRSQA